MDNELDFADLVTDTVKTLSAHESAVAHSSVRALILRELIRSGEDGSDAFTDLNGAARRQLIDAVIANSEDDLIAAEYQSMLSHIPSGEDSTAEVSVWGEQVLSQAYLNAVQTLGKPCGDPGNFQSSLLAIVTVGSYKEGIRRNIVAGGCNCSRANFVGASLGAAYGLDGPNGIPLEWLEQTDKGVETLQLALRLFAPAI